MKRPAAYILASSRNGTSYVGVTSNLVGRVHQHRIGAGRGFASRYGVDLFVWFELHETMESAIVREKKLKDWRRAWKIAPIEADKLRRRDLAEDVGLPPVSSCRTRSGIQSRERLHPKLWMLTFAGMTGHRVNSLTPSSG